MYYTSDTTKAAPGAGEQCITPEVVTSSALENDIPHGLSKVLRALTLPQLAILLWVSRDSLLTSYQEVSLGSPVAGICSEKCSGLAFFRQIE